MEELKVFLLTSYHAGMSRCLCLLIEQVEKSLQYQGENVSAPDRVKIEAQVNTLKEAMQVEDTGRIRTQVAELQRAMMS